MRATIFVFFLVLALGVRPGILFAAEPRELTLVAFNIHLGGSGPGGNGDVVRYFLRHLLHLIGLGRDRSALLQALDRTGDFLVDLDPDLVVVNEFSPCGLLSAYTRSESDADPEMNAVTHLLNRLNRDGADWQAHFEPYMDNWAGLFGNLVLYRRDRGLQDPRIHVGTFERRGRLDWYERLVFSPLFRNYILLDLEVGGRRVFFAGTHLEDHQDRHNVAVRRLAMRQMVSELEDLRAAAGDPLTFVLGDLNAIPPAYYEGDFDPKVKHAFRHDTPGDGQGPDIQQNTIQILEEDYVSTYVSRHGGIDAGSWTSPVDNPRYALDYIYFTPSTAGGECEVLDCFVPRVFAVGDTISDHLPVVARVRLTDPTGS